MKCPICGADNKIFRQAVSDEMFEFIETNEEAMAEQTFKEFTARVKCNTCEKVFRLER